MIESQSVSSSDATYVPETFDFISRVHNDGVLNPISCMLIIGVDIDSERVTVRAWHQDMWITLERSFSVIREYIGVAEAKIFKPVTGEYKPQNGDFMVLSLLGIPDFDALRYLYDVDEERQMVDVYAWRFFQPVKFLPMDFDRIKQEIEDLNLTVYRAID